VSKGAYAVAHFVYNNPQVLYKGMPVLLAVYTFYPLIAFSWQIVPVAMATYDIYNRLPSGTIPAALNTAKKYFR
jgi:hypothetical protein